MAPSDLLALRMERPPVNGIANTASRNFNERIMK